MVLPAADESTVPSPATLRASVAGWLADHGAELPDREPADRSYAARVDLARRVQRTLHDAGWGRYGWPTTIGGLGGTIVHRAVVYEELARAGFPDRGPFEHAEILVPPLLQRWTSEELAAALPPFLRGDEVWCQGFSEPDAGSDLGSLRTRAVRDGDEYRIDGRKVWTSWAAYASRCLLLARTGSVADRHRGLSAFMVDLDQPGVEVRAIRQTNGHDELAEVVFDGVRAPVRHRIGEEGDGWRLALDILVYERGSSSWLRQALLYARAEELAATGRPTPQQLGDVLLDLHALRLASASAVLLAADDALTGPDAALVKLLRTDAEQHLYELADRSSGGDLALGSDADERLGRWQDEYLFSRAVSIYGGTRQMQLNTVAKYVLGVGAA